MDIFVKKFKLDDTLKPSTSGMAMSTNISTSTIIEDEEELSSSSEQQTVSKSLKRKKYTHQQQYTRKWEAEFKWCAESKFNKSLAYCKVCNKEIKGNRSHLKRHEENNIHIKNMPQKQNVVHIDTVIKKMNLKNDLQVKIGELKLAACVAEHDFSFKVMEHLPHLIRSICVDSDVARNIKSSRTKTTSIINKTIGPFVTKNIVSIINKRCFSIIIDETTDVSTKKCLAILLRYYSDESKKVCDSFLGLVELEAGSTAAAIHEALRGYLVSVGVDLDNLAGFAADNCSTMMGQLNGVQSILKKEHPHLIVVGCTSHSFNLCSSYACQKLPKGVEDLVRDIYSHFAHSSKRLNVLREFQNFCELKPHKILRPSETRWLSLHQVVNRVIEQYDALLLYFTNSVFEDPLSKTLDILNHLKNRTNKLYLLFLSYILKIVNTMNIEFQSEQPRLHELMPRISQSYKQILGNYMKSEYIDKTRLDMINPNNTSHFLPLNEIYLGVNVQTFIDDESNINPTELHDFRLKTLSFYIELCSQIRTRFPFGSELFSQLTWLDPLNIYSEKRAVSIIPLVKKFPNMVDKTDFENINSEWRLLFSTKNDKFHSKMSFETLIDELDCSKNALDESLFPTLSKFLKNISCLPHGSAAAERIFSSLNLIKRKSRNCLDTHTCNNLLLTKEMLKNTTCYEWQPPNELVRSFE